MDTALIDLCRKANVQTYRPGAGAADYESEFVAVVHYIQSQTDSAACEQFFVEALERPDLACIELIQFVCRVFQYPRVRARAKEILSKADDLRIKRALSLILEVYEGHWQDADLYSYFAMQEPCQLPPGWKKIDFDEGQGYPAGPNLLYQCRLCQGLLVSQPTEIVQCACGNIFIDVDAGRIIVEKRNALVLLERPGRN